MDFKFTEDQKVFRQNLRKFAQEQIAPRSGEWDESMEHSWELWGLLKKQGLFQLHVPKEYGGVGVSSVKICIAREELSQVCVLAEYMVADQGTGTYPIVLAGTKDQKRKYLPGLATGDTTAALCITEPGAGSDVAGIETTARLDGDHYFLNGTKIFLHKPHLLKVLCLFAKTDASKGSKGISGIIVETDKVKDMQVKKYKLMYALDIGELAFTNCKIPKENILGELGRGMRIALGTLNVYRCTVGAQAVGMAQAALDLAVEYGKKRKAFGKPLVEFQWWQFKLAEMATEIDAGRLLTYRAAQLRDENPDSIVIKEASMAKLFCGEMASRTLDQAMQIFGGHGLHSGTRIERLYRQSRAARIYEGTSEMQRLVIARSILKD